MPDYLLGMVVNKKNSLLQKNLQSDGETDLKQKTNYEQINFTL